MKVLTVAGTRPELIRLSRIIGKLDKLCKHVFVHTGQNYDFGLNEVFFQQLGIRKPDHCLDARGSFSEQIATILTKMEKLLKKDRPDRFLVLGDTNSATAAIVAKRMAIPVYHMEAGNRCFDDRVPEEVNRRIVDACSDVFMPYTERSRQNLLQEGIDSDRILVIGNPIYEVLEGAAASIKGSKVLSELKLTPKGYFLVTAHREENVDLQPRLRALVESLSRVNSKYRMPVVVSTHPRTHARMQEFGVVAGGGDIRFMEPFGFFDFVALEQNAFCVLSDSGTVQEECAIFHVPNVTLRDVTERLETVETGSNILSGVDPDCVARCVEAAVGLPATWNTVPEYRVGDVSSAVVKIVLGHRGKQYLSDEAVARVVQEKRRP